MNGEKVPVRTLIELQRYVRYRTPTGGFLRAVLENDLRESVFRADDDNLESLIQIVKYVYNELPHLCWGSPEKVQKWISNADSLPDEAHRCAICRTNWVDSDNGFDTCKECSQL